MSNVEQGRKEYGGGGEREGGRVSLSEVLFSRESQPRKMVFRMFVIPRDHPSLPPAKIEKERKGREKKDAHLIELEQ